MTNAEQIAAVLLSLYALDRALKFRLVTQFFAAHPAPAAPPNGWPSVALIQPVTRGATNLGAHLDARAALDYPGTVQHVIVCDAADAESQERCRAALPDAVHVTADPDVPGAAIASKVAKMTAGLAAMGEAAEVVCFVDDDILLPSDALQQLVAPLYAKTPAGATFGLACQISWCTVWESLMSAFVNANALTSYVPLTFFTEPYTVTGHLFALRRTVFEQAGGMGNMDQRFDDDHEIARRVRALNLPLVQTPLVYKVENALSSWSTYCAQLRRWFVIPREGMAPFLTLDERIITTLLSTGNLLPPALLLLALVAPGPRTLACAVLAFALFLAVYVSLETRYLTARTPARRFALLPVIAFWTPLQVLFALAMPGDRIVWRGQAWRAKRGGALEVEGSTPPAPPTEISENADVPEVPEVPDAEE